MAVTRRNVYLAGMMGTGKSTVGRELARLMGRKFIDTDSALERRVGMTVSECFAREGEAFFRAQEKALALELATMTNRVVATGGGTLLDAEVRRLFIATGVVICLFTQSDQLVTRLERTDKRPLLHGVDLKDRVDELLAQRKEIYDNIQIRIDTTNLTPAEAAGKIFDLLKLRQKILDQLQSQYIVIT
jgi:shikimate kinase